VVSEELGLKIDEVDLDVLGKSSRVVSKKDSTVIIGGKGKKSEIDSRVKELKKQKEVTKSKFDIEKIEERIAKLSGGVAVIRVGAATETEMKYLKLKIEDAVNATKAAIDEGIVLGGGVALVKASEKVKSNMEKKRYNDEIRVGYEIVLNACEVPLKQIAVNGGKGDGSIVVEYVKKTKGNSGYNALKDEYVADMFETGIIDPVKVTRTGLQNAASASAILLTTEAAVTEEPKDDKFSQGSVAGGMDY
jgi:chaperonin GroEL